MANETEFVEVSGYSAKDIADAEARGQTQARTNIVGGTTAAQANVLEGKTFSSAVAGDKKAGSMYNYSDDTGARGKVNAVINPTGVYNIPEGYHRGGKVTANPNQNSGTYPASSRAAALDMGANNTYRYVNTTGVPNSNSAIYTAPTPTDGTENANTFDMGAANTYRYVKTKNAYDRGYAFGYNAARYYDSDHISAGASEDNGHGHIAGNGSVIIGVVENSTGLNKIVVITVCMAKKKGNDYAWPDISYSGTGATYLSGAYARQSYSDGDTNVMANIAMITHAYKIAPGAEVTFTARETNAKSGAYTYSITHVSL